MTIRFPAELPYIDSLPLISVGDLVNQGRIVEAVNFMAANQKACANTLGAVNYWRAQYVPTPPVVITPALALYETRNVTDGQPGTVYSMQADADGKTATVEVSGSPPVTFSAGPQGSFDDPSRKAVGAGAAGPLAIKKGEWMNWKYDAPQGGQNMRPQLLP